MNKYDKEAQKEWVNNHFSKWEDAKEICKADLFVAFALMLFLVFVTGFVS